jgi:hypothetical protein
LKKFFKVQPLFFVSKENMQPTTQWIGTLNLTPGRCSPGVPLAIVLHEVDLPIESIDGDANFIQYAQANHTSFHYAISDCVIHQYVQVADTAWSFSPTADLSPWAVAVANAGINPNCYTINIAVSTGSTTSTSSNCPRPDNFYSLNTKRCLAQLLCWLAEQNNIALDADHIWRHELELVDMPLADIIALAIECQNAPPIDPDPTLDSLCDQLAAMTTGGVATTSTLLVGADCHTYTVPAGGGVVPATLVCDQIGTFPAGATIAPTTELVGADCNTYTVAQITSGIDVCASLAALPAGATIVGTTELVGADCNTYTVDQIVGAIDVATIVTEIINNDLSDDIVCDAFIDLPASATILPTTELVGSDCQTYTVAQITSTIDVATIVTEIINNDLSDDIVCDAFTSLPAGATIDGTTPLVGADCQTYTVAQLSGAIDICAALANADPATVDATPTTAFLADDCTTYTVAQITAAIDVATLVTEIINNDLSDDIVCDAFNALAAGTTIDGTTAFVGADCQTYTLDQIAGAIDICPALAALPTNGVAATSTLLVGADCNTYTLPDPADVLCAIPTGTYDPALPTKMFQDQSGNCVAIEIPAPDIADCANKPSETALTPQGWRPIAQKRFIESFSGSSYIPNSMQHLVIGTGNFDVQPPVNCDYTWVTVKNGTAAPLTITGNFDGAAGATITLAGSNGFGTAWGESVDLEWSSALGTYIVH